MHDDRKPSSASQVTFRNRRRFRFLLCYRLFKLLTLVGVMIAVLWSLWKLW